jgi:hypothetical protein
MNVKSMSNQKRIDSCRDIGEKVRRIGHAREVQFKTQFNSITELNRPSYRAEADASFDSGHPIHKILLEKLDISGTSCSIKSGQNLQFVLGNLDQVEISQGYVERLNSDVELSRSLLDRYLRKSGSDLPAEVLVYYYDDIWVFFSIEDVVTYISDRCSWRLTSTARSIKGDFRDASRRGVRQYLTIEVRKGKGTFFGANGNRGRLFIDLLMHPEFGIRHHIEEVAH